VKRFLYLVLTIALLCPIAYAQEQTVQNQINRADPSEVAAARAEASAASAAATAAAEAAKEAEDARAAAEAAVAEAEKANKSAANATAMALGAAAVANIVDASAAGEEVSAAREAAKVMAARADYASKFASEASAAAEAAKSAANAKTAARLGASRSAKKEAAEADALAKHAASKAEEAANAAAIAAASATAAKTAADAVEIAAAPPTPKPAVEEPPAAPIPPPAQPESPTAAPAPPEQTAPPRIAVYVTGDLSEHEKSLLGSRMLASIVNSGRYTAVDRNDAFIAEVEKERAKLRGGALDGGQISELGKRFGAKYVCRMNAAPAFGSYHVSARIIDVETASVVFTGEELSSLKTADDLREVTEKVARNMFGDQTAAAEKTAAARQDGDTPVSTADADDSDTQLQPDHPVSPKAAEIIDAAIKVRNATLAVIDAVSKSATAAQAIVTATQSKSFSAIMDAKKKSEAAIAAVKKAKEDVEAAKEALNATKAGATQEDLDQLPDGVKKIIAEAETKEGGQGAQSAYQDFTASERFGTFFVNHLIPGLGSFTITKDNVGGGVQLGLSGSGYLLVIIGSATYIEGITYIGLTSLTAGLIYNIVRSTTYKKPMPAGTPTVGYGLLEGVNGNYQHHLTYNMEF
jgi:hypothetical protein